ncbi:MAG: hypothetical protein Q9166_005401 [cf. Caloplaca sp. 2 TL-2023]
MHVPSKSVLISVLLAGTVTALPVDTATRHTAIKRDARYKPFPKHLPDDHPKKYDDLGKRGVVGLGPKPHETKVYPKITLPELGSTSPYLRGPSIPVDGKFQPIVTDKGHYPAIGNTPELPADAPHTESLTPHLPHNPGNTYSGGAHPEKHIPDAVERHLFSPKSSADDTDTLPWYGKGPTNSAFAPYLDNDELDSSTNFKRSEQAARGATPPCPGRPYGRCPNDPQPAVYPPKEKRDNLPANDPHPAPNPPTKRSSHAPNSPLTLSNLNDQQPTRTATPTKDENTESSPAPPSPSPKLSALSRLPWCEIFFSHTDCRIQAHEEHRHLSSSTSNPSDLRHKMPCPGCLDDHDRRPPK